MKREELISKWLDNNLNDQELEAFKALEDYFYAPSQAIGPTHFAIRPNFLRDICYEYLPACYIDIIFSFLKPLVSVMFGFIPFPVSYLLWQFYCDKSRVQSCPRTYFNLPVHISFSASLDFPQ